MGAYTYITDSNHCFVDRNVCIKDQGMEIGSVKIGSNIWLGRAAFILKDSVVEDGSIVGASSIVTKKFKRNVVIAGIPARIIKER